MFLHGLALIILAREQPSLYLQVCRSVHVSVAIRGDVPSLAACTYFLCDIGGFYCFMDSLIPFFILRFLMKAA